MPTDPMSKQEREELSKLVRRREKLAKADVDRVAAERRAEFEARLAKRYDAYDARWRDATQRMTEAMEQLNEQITEQLIAEGQPREFCPKFNSLWFARGENSTAGRRVELRAVATSHINALAKQAKVEIERQSVDFQTELVASGLRSEEARAFLAQMPTAEELLPAPSLGEIEAAAEEIPAGERRRLRR